MSEVLWKPEFYLPEGSVPIESEDDIIFGAIWDEDETESLMPEVVQPRIFTFDLEREDYRYWMIRNMGQFGLWARQAAQLNATSWRGLRVGVAMGGIDQDRSRIAFFAQGNHKPEEKAWTNCGEISSLLHATEVLRLTRIPFVAIAATDNKKRIEEINHVESATLHPCWRCNDAMHASAEIDDNSLIASLGKYKDIAQYQSMAEFHDRYEGVGENGEGFEDARAYRFIKNPDYWREG